MRQNKFFTSSRSVIPAFVVGVSGLLVAVSVYAAPISVTTTFMNEAPSVTVDPSDGGSDGTTPTNVGSNVTFTATATDSNLDNYYLAVCKTNAVTAGSSAAPTCDGGSWAISTATASGAQATVTYTALVGDAESNVWYAFVCDGNGTPGLCSASNQGSASPSPFKVNHAGTFGTVTVTDSGDGTIAPGDTLKFLLPNAQIDDTDSDTAQDTLTMHICTEATTSYDYSTNSCTGGASICDSVAVNPTTTDASCTGGASLVSVPTAHGSYNFDVYVEDQHNFPATGTASQSYSVIDVAPVWTSYTTADTLTIAAGGSDTLTRAVTYSDDNGDNDPTALDLVFFEDTAVNDNCTSSELNCYRIDNANPASLPGNCSTSTLSTPGTGKTATGTDASVTISCDFTVWFNAAPSGNWEVSATVTDGLGDTNFADSDANTNIAALSAIGVAEASIPYGIIAVGGTSAAQTITLQNAGNIITDVLISGTNMTSGGNTISRAQQHWSPTGTWTWGTDDFALVQTPSVGSAVNGCSDRTISITTDHSVYTTSQIFWKLKIPSAQATGSYSGTTTFAATANDCSGGI